MSEFVPQAVRDTLHAAATAAGTDRVLARLSWLEATCNLEAAGPGYFFRVGQKAFNTGCPDCVSVYAVNDWEIPSDWMVI